MRGLVSWIAWIAFAQVGLSPLIAAQPLSIETDWIHLRSGVQREWSEFPPTASGSKLTRVFAAKRNSVEWAMILRQQDVKQAWRVLLNGRKLGELVRDENDMKVAMVVPEGTLIDGDNTLEIEASSASSATSDDIRVGQISLVETSVDSYLNQAQLEVEVIDSHALQPLPCRLTLIDAQGSMQSCSVQPAAGLAARPGVVVSGTGKALIGLPAGTYTLYAGRGFEYSLDRVEVVLTPGARVHQILKINREVSTEGYVASDTHVHTLTHSGHGDATIEERVITLAAEGIELPIATDHNKYIDLEGTANQLGVRSFFTPVVGCEVTTPRGHFNIFPVAAGAPMVDYKQTDWGQLFDGIQRTPGVRVAILNHARDLHGGVRPFGPEHHRALVGENTVGWPLRFNAMEVVNSGAVQTDPYQLFRDWLGLLNRGLSITPIGSSDSHDVGRHFVGQGRTYIRVDDRDPSQIDIAEAMNSFVAGRVMVSYGLLTELTVNGRYHSGDCATDLSSEEIRVDVRVLGPHWTEVSQVQLLANGLVIQQAEVSGVQRDALPEGVKWQGTWKIPKPHHDVHLVAIASGPAITGYFWRTAKPYQPVSPDWHGGTIGCSGAVWLDVDQDGQPTSARANAERMLVAAGKNWSGLIETLAPYDEATAAQVAHLLHSMNELDSDMLREALKRGAPATVAGFQAYQAALRDAELARAP